MSFAIQTGFLVVLQKILNLRLFVATVFLHAAWTAYAQGSIGSPLSDFEPNNDVQSAEEILVGREVEGSLSGMTDVDYYQFSVTDRVRLTISFRSEKSELSGWRYDILSSDSTVLGSSVCDSSGCVSGETLSTGLQAGTYYLKVYPEVDSTDDYYLPDGSYYFLIDYGDKDDDGVLDEDDNCLTDANPNQLNTDSDPFGDVCDDDDDGDGILDEIDQFPLDPDESSDADGDEIGDNADDDDDNDLVKDSEDAFPLDPKESEDTDGDGVGNNADAFPNDPNESSDQDDDGVGDNSDNCPTQANPEQQNFDQDPNGDACDEDDDDDGVDDELDFYPLDDSRSSYCCQKALIVAGGGPYFGNALWSATKNMANLAYDALIFQGLDDEDIIYLSEEDLPVVDGKPSNDAVRASILSLSTSDEEEIDHILIYLVDHGGDQIFKLTDTELLHAEDLKSWIDSMHESFDGRSTVVYDACESGSFVTTLAAEGDSDRLIITSTAERQPAVFALNGYTSFSYFFWSSINNGLSLDDSQIVARQAMRLIWGQDSQVDSDGDGIANTKDDKRNVSNFAFGQRAARASDNPILEGIDVPAELNGETEIEVFVKNVVGGTKIKRVMVFVDNPDSYLPIPDEPLIEVETTLLQSNPDGSWSGVIRGFDIAGDYDVSVVGENQSGLLSIPDENSTLRVTQKIGREPIVEVDTDGDGLGDFQDADDDNDGIADEDDAFPTDPTESSDFDSDGIGDNADDDDDNDGLSDFDETTAGTDAFDADSDDDGYADGEDDLPTDGTEWLDTDGDGLGNNEDTDDDNDGIADLVEVESTGTNPLNKDSDSDGVDDAIDIFPLDASESIDTDVDGIGDNKDDFPEDPTEWMDTDLDGVGDNSDAFPNDVSETVDTDGDGIGNNGDLDDDNDGFTDEEELADGTNPLSRFSCRSGCFSFDIDENKEAKALSDGLLVIRHLFGFSGDSLTSGATTAEGARTSAEAISNYLSDADSELDIDGDGQSKALTDGLLLIRYLFGFSGDSLTAGAIGEGAERTTAEEIQAYIGDRVPSE